MSDITFSNAKTLMKRLEHYTSNQTSQSFDINDQLLIADLIACAKLGNISLEEVLNEIKEIWPQVHISDPHNHH